MLRRVYIHDAMNISLSLYVYIYIYIPYHIHIYIHIIYIYTYQYIHVLPFAYSLLSIQKQGTLPHSQGSDSHKGGRHLFPPLSDNDSSFVNFPKTCILWWTIEIINSHTNVPNTYNSNHAGCYALYIFLPELLIWVGFGTAMKFKTHQQQMNFIVWLLLWICFSEMRVYLYT